MADIYVGGDTELWIAEQATYGTAIADDAAGPHPGGWTVIQCMAPKIVPDVLVREVTADRGVRYQDVKDFAVSDTGAMPKVTIPDHPVRKDILARFLYTHLQEVVEEIGTPFKKVFNYPSTTHPDFGSDEGCFLSVIQKLPIASNSLKVTDAIGSKLNFSCSPKGALLMSADLIGRGPISLVANPTATQLYPADDFFYFEDMVRFTYDVGSGATAAIPFAWSLELTKKEIPVGFDSASGKYQNITFSEYGGTFKMTVLWDVNTKELFSDLQDGTPIEINIGWGNATPGTVDGDLDFTLIGLIDTASLERGDTLNKEITIKLLADVANTDIPVEIILADAVDYTW